MAEVNSPPWRSPGRGTSRRRCRGPQTTKRDGSLCSCGNGRRRAASQGQVTGEGLHRGVYFNRTETVPDRQPGRRSKQVPRPRQDWIAIAVPAIIDERTF